MAGIIPADAGSTTSSYGISNLRKDHPRGCGEHDDIPARLSNGEGSSPRMRGALSSFILPRPVLGIIPADAGSTNTMMCCPVTCWDHPRGCGEHLVGPCAFVPHAGSSPRMRGARVRQHLDHHVGGIIPADAGSTHRLPLVHLCPSQGSSPRMRGARRPRRAEE